MTLVSPGFRYWFSAGWPRPGVAAGEEAGHEDLQQERGEGEEACWIPIKIIREQVGGKPGVTLAVMGG